MLLLPDNSAEIERLVSKIIPLVRKCDPMELLVRCNKISMLDFVDFKDEAQRELSRDAGLLRAGEYVQSILVSSDLNCGDAIDGRVGNPIDEAIDLIRRLYNEIYSFLIRHALDKTTVHNGVGQKGAPFSFMLLYHSARGGRDFSRQRRFFEPFLMAHDGVFRAVYGVGAQAVVDGLMRLLRNLAYSSLYYYQRHRSQRGLLRDIRHSPPVGDIADEFDVRKVTGWPDSLVDSLSYDINETSGFGIGQYAGWPIKEFSVRRRPFVRIADKVYAFNYYPVSDYFYRALQTETELLAGRRNIPCQWNASQCLASETEARRIFEKILPGAKIYSSNFYPIAGEDGRWAENDLIVCYSDIRIIVEVKGGKIKFRAPIESPTAVRKGLTSFKEAIGQCNRTEAYLRSCDDPAIYDRENGARKPGFSCQMKDVIFKLAVSVDGLNEITSSAESLDETIGSTQGVICLSFDDLHVYEDYFSGMPATFLWYLSERTRLTAHQEVYSADELDHLAGFINCPWMAERADKCVAEGFNRISLGGADELNDYLAASLNPTRKVEKPLPAFSFLAKEVLDFLNRAESCHKMALIDIIMKLDGMGRTEIENKLQELLADLSRGGARSRLVLGCGVDGVGIAIGVCEDQSSLRSVSIVERFKERGIKSWRVFLFVYHGLLDGVSYLQGGALGEITINV